MARTYLKGIGLLVGLIFGAGIFVLPSAIAKAGMFWGVVHFAIAAFLVLIMHLLYAEIAYAVPGRHRLVGYVKLILGEKAGHLSFLMSIFSFYGSLLVYGVLGGIFLSNIFSFLGYENASLFFSLVFFLIGGALLWLKSDKIAAINFYLVIPLLGFVVYLLFVCLPHIDLKNFYLFSPSGNAWSENWFLPYGIWIFSLTGFSAIPEVRDLFSKLSFNPPTGGLKSAILTSTLLVVVFYWLFIIGILGTSGSATTEDAFSGIVNTAGNKIIAIGSLIGFLAVFTSFLALGMDLRHTFQLDYKLNRFLSWLLVISPPIFLFYLGFHNLSAILSIVGSFGLGSVGLFIIFMARKKRKSILGIIAVLAILAAVVYEIVNMIY